MNPNPDRKPLILIVDDAPQNLALMDELLSDRYTVKVAPNGARGLKLAHAVTGSMFADNSRTIRQRGTYP